MLFTGLRTGIRRFTTSAVRRSGEYQDAQPGANLPFGNSYKNKYAFTVGFTLFFGSGLTMPFLAVRQSILKK